MQICAIIDEKSSNLENFVKHFSHKNFNQTIQRRSPIINENNSTLSLKILATFFISTKLRQILAKITEKVNKNCRIFTKFQSSISPFKYQNSK